MRVNMRLGLVLGVVLVMIGAGFTAIPGIATPSLEGPVLGEASGTIYIKPDGSVDPASAPIHVHKDRYRLTADIYESIYVQRSGITLIGGGYTIEGPGTGFGVYLQSVSDVTLKNLIVKGFDMGIELENSDHNTIVGSMVTEAGTNGIRLSASSFNTIMKNDVYANNWDGITLRRAGGIGSSDNLITKNKAHDNLVAGIRIRDFEDRRNSITKNTVYAQLYGIWDMGGDYTKIEKNVAYQNSEAGIYVSATLEGLVEKNVAYQNSKEGLFCWGIRYSVVRKNTLWENGEHGLMIRAGVYSTYEQNTILNNRIGIGFRRGATGHNLIQRNWIQGHEIGLNVFDLARNNNVITLNMIKQNDIGATLDATTSTNILHHNNFIENPIQAYDNGANIWDDGSGEGNYWSDYTGSDLDDDGVGDTDLPHQGLDWHPLMEPCYWDEDEDVGGQRVYNPQAKSPATETHLPVPSLQGRTEHSAKVYVSK